MVEHLSPSSINEFFNCPRKWYYARVLSLPPMIVYNENLVFGKLVHQCIAQYYNVLLKSDVKLTAKMVDETVRQVFEDVFSKSGVGRRYKGVMENFISFEVNRLKTEFKPTFVEREFEFKGFKIVVDFYNQESRTVIDWKTGEPILDDAMIIQGKLYELILKRLGFSVERVLFVFLRNNMVQQLPQVDEVFVSDKIRRMMNMVNLNYFPKNFKFCIYCEYSIPCQLEGRKLWADVMDKCFVKNIFLV